MVLEVQILGGFSVKHNGLEVDGLRAERLILFLSYLFLNSETPVSRKQLAFLFWPDSTEAQARANARNLLHHLRHALPEIDSLLDMDSQTLRWKADASFYLDVLQFKQALAAAREAQDEAGRIRLLQEAAGHYHGELLPGFYEDWVLLEREELHQAFIKTLSQLAKLLEEARQYMEAIEVVNRLIRSDPFNEAAYQHAMRLHALNNDRAGAIQIYHACSTLLLRELGIEPAAETKAFYEQLLRSGDTAMQDRAREPAPRGRRLIGRKLEWNRLREVWQSVQKGKPQTVLILGEAGIGKTRLATELAQWAQRQGILTAGAQCYPVEGNLPFGPVVAWLRAGEIRIELAKLEALWVRELERLMPEVEAGKTEAPADSPNWQRRRLFEAMARGLLGSGTPRLLMMDDAQWADAETLEFLHYLMRFNPSARMLLLMTARLEELEDGHPLNQLRLALQSKGQVVEIELNPLDRHELRLLARDVSEKDLSDESEALLFSETEGNPFFLVEILRSGEYGEGKSLPTSLRSVLTRRLHQLSPAARDLAGLAAAIGREFNLRTLGAASTLNEDELIQALDELWARRIIQIQQGDTYHFTHGKLQDAAYETLSFPRRQMLHRRIAETLLSEREAESALIAAHYEAAGQYPQAVEHYLKAAQEARRVFANRDAIAHLERGLSLLTGKVGIGDDAQRRQARQALEALGDISDISGSGKAALKSYREALTYILPLERLDRARVLGKVAKTLGYESDLAGSVRLFAEAEQELGEPSVENENEYWHTWLKLQFDRAWMYYDQSQIAELEAALAPIRPVVERLGELETLAEYYYLLPTAYFRRDGYQMNDEIMRFSALALETSLKTGNLELHARANFGYGFCNFLRGRFDLAVHYLDEGLKLAGQIGYVEQQILCITYLAAAHRGASDLEECWAYAERALALCERENAQTYAATARANLGWVAWKQNNLKRAGALCRQALTEWGPYYPFRWFGLWVLVDLSLLALRTDEALEFARQLKAPGQQVFAKDGDDLLAEAITAAAQGDAARAELLLKKAVEWAEENHYL